MLRFPFASVILLMVIHDLSPPGLLPPNSNYEKSERRGSWDVSVYRRESEEEVTVKKVIRGEGGSKGG